MRRFPHPQLHTGQGEGSRHPGHSRSASGRSPCEASQQHMVCLVFWGLLGPCGLSRTNCPQRPDNTIPTGWEQAQRAVNPDSVCVGGGGGQMPASTGNQSLSHLRQDSPCHASAPPPAPARTFLAEIPPDCRKEGTLKKRPLCWGRPGLCAVCGSPEHQDRRLILPRRASPIPCSPVNHPGPQSRLHPLCARLPTPVFWVASFSQASLLPRG